MSAVTSLTNPSKHVLVKQFGSSMIEVLVALFIMAIGLMAVQAMQLSSLRTNTASALGSDAQMLASNMIDRILAYDDISDATDNNAYADIDTSNAAADPGCDAGGCNQAQQKSRDEHFWKTEVENHLPGGVGMVTSDGGGIYTVTVMWDNDKTGANGTACSGNSDVDLTCYRVQLNM